MTADPTRPEPPPAAPWDRVLIALDRDMKPVKAKTWRIDRRGRDKTIEVQLDAEARMRICSRLAKHWWRATGVQARAFAPPPGMDFNDKLKAVRRG